MFRFILAPVYMVMVRVCIFSDGVVPKFGTTEMFQFPMVFRPCIAYIPFPTQRIGSIIFVYYLNIHPKTNNTYKDTPFLTKVRSWLRAFTLDPIPFQMHPNPFQMHPNPFQSTQTKLPLSAKCSARQHRGTRGTHTAGEMSDLTDNV